VLLGDLPNVYVYAANNPSESIIAKRRGYGTIVSHNVPPYGRCPGFHFLCSRCRIPSIDVQWRMHVIVGLPPERPKGGLASKIVRV